MASNSCLLAAMPGEMLLLIMACSKGGPGQVMGWVS